MTRGRGFSSYRGSSGRNWSDPSESSYNSHHNSIPRFSSFSSSMESRSRYHPPTERYGGGSSRNPYEVYHKSYRSEMSGGYSGRDGHRSPDRKRLREEAPRRSREVDSFSSSSSRYTPSFMDRSFRDRRPPPPPTISRREDFRRPLPPSSPRGGYRGRLSSRGLRGIRPRDGPPRRRLVESSYAIRRRVPPLISSDYTRRLKVSRLRSAIARRAAIKRKESSDKDDSDDEKKSADEKEKKEKSEKLPSDIEGDEEKDNEGSVRKKESDKEKGEEDDKEGISSTRSFIKLVCPHCNTKCLTFSKYGAHLYGGRHMLAMRQVAMKQKTILARMRLSQRNAQRELEKNSDELAPRTNFCPLCKLNYKQPKITHQESDTHKTMKKFLMPYCKFCKITFKSPMIYETHICSIDHLKRKARRDVNGDKSDNDSEDLLEHFMTIDSVGDVDDGIEVKKKDKDKPESEGKTKIPVNVGIEKIKKIEVYYCDLCRMYLPRVEQSDLEKTLSKHCKQRTHLQRYIRYKEDKEIARRAEKLQRKETAEKEREKVKEEAKIKEEAQDKEDGEDKDEKADEDETIDDKLWADDVNKDLGDILAEAESGNKSSDDEGGERFDRFGTSEKNGEEVKDINEEKDDVKTENADGSIENK